MGRKERKRYEDNKRVRDLLDKPLLAPEEIEYIKTAYTGAGGLTATDWANGQFFTPPVVTEFTMLMMGIEGGRVLEPSCGGGAFLNVLPPTCDAYASEMMAETARVAEVCYPHAEIRQGDGLEMNWSEPFDYVIGNPPYGLHVPNWTFISGSNRSKSEVAFIEYGLMNLKPGGVLGMIIPDSVLSGNKDYEFRRWALEENQLLAVVSLPTETFYHTGTTVKTSLLMIQKGREQEDYKVFMALCDKIGWDSRGRKTNECALPAILHEYLNMPENHINRRKQQQLPELVPANDKYAVFGQLALAL